MSSWCFFFLFFFFNDTATTEIYTLSLHDALPIYPRSLAMRSIIRSRKKSVSNRPGPRYVPLGVLLVVSIEDRKSTRLNSSHVRISYAVFCLKKKRKKD